MLAVIQRVSSASVAVDGGIVGSISGGILVLLAVHHEDGEEDLNFIKKKIINLRIFEDGEGKMNRSVAEVGGEVLVVSQFTLYGDCRKGNRPSYSQAAPPEKARRLYERLIEQIRSEGVIIESGRFQAMMQVSLVNDGPVTLIVDSRKEQG
ncbi:MAG: D-aminoacyl-tRNA deacylase [Acidobacteriota bacterium]